MKNEVFIVCLLMTVYGLAAGQDSKYKNLQDCFSEKKQILVVGHRTAQKGSEFSENSLSGIKDAIGKIDMLEIDVRKTKDGKYILMHDRTIDRTTNGSGEVSQFTYKELSQFSLVHNSQTTGEKIPLLKEALIVAKGKIFLFLDLKDIDETFFDLIAQYKMTDQVMCLPNNKPNDSTFVELELASKMGSNILFAPWCRDLSNHGKVINQYPYQKLVHVIIWPQYQEDLLVVKRVCKLARANQKAIVFNVLFSKYNKALSNGQEELIEQLIALHPDMIFTDYPVLFKNYLSI